MLRDSHIKGTTCITNVIPVTGTAFKFVLSCRNLYDNFENLPKLIFQWEIRNQNRLRDFDRKNWHFRNDFHLISYNWRENRFSFYSVNFPQKWKTQQGNRWDLRKIRMARQFFEARGFIRSSTLFEKASLIKRKKTS